MDMGTPLRRVVGDRTARALERGLGLRTVHDLVRHYPRRYYERGDLTDLASLEPGQEATFQARVVRIKETRPRPKLHKTDVEVTDGHTVIPITFFNARWIAGRLNPGMEVMFAGTVESFRGKRRLTNPEVALDDDAASFARSIQPVYPATKALRTWRIARCIGVVLDVLGDLPDPLPETTRARRRYPDLRQALEDVHRPRERADWVRARERLRFEEAFVLQVELARRRRAAAALPALPRRAAESGMLAAFDARLPFTLTAGQRDVGDQIAADLAQEHPMHRLLQGEVGSGKTVVALRAMLTVVDGGGQAALLAPTEVLAQQHHRTVTSLLGPLAERGMLGGDEGATRVTLLTGSQTTSVRRRALLDVASGEAGIVIGTHALLEERVQFADLGLVVVDEQHRFGVEQRAALAAKTAAGARPHVLVMTATPIPRTVAMTVFGDLETSTLAEVPAGRADVDTHVVPERDKPHFLARTWQRVREEAEAGHQVYVVCPRIGGLDDEGSSDAGTEDGDRGAGAGDDQDDAAAGAEDDHEGTAADDGGHRDAQPPERPRAVLELMEELGPGPLAGIPVGILHGRMTPDDKDAAMARFATGEVPVLVATTVVEVGVDVPEASTMVVVDAERFGVSQLHQLRGRVGRGSVPGLCLLVTRARPGSAARRRLDAVAATRDGFVLSRVDLEQRREGDVLGASQSGRQSSLRLLSVIRHEDVIRDARAEATLLVEADPDLVRHPALARLVADIAGGDRADYLEKA